MKSVLISIRPEWCEEIASGIKTIEVRKNRPKIDTPFKCYIYCTKNGCFMEKSKTNPAKRINRINKYGGKVIAEFVCSNIFEAKLGNYVELPYMYTGLTTKETLRYAEGKTLYGWYISKLIIYDKPKKLSEFVKPCKTSYECKNCNHSVLWDGRVKCDKILYRPPQSWCYVESEVESK